MGCSTPAEKSDVVARVAPLVALVPDPVARVEWARRLAVAAGADREAVETVVRSSARGRGIAAGESVVKSVKPRTESGEERHLRLLALILVHNAVYATDEISQSIQELIPEGPCKRMIFHLIDAAAEGLITDDGAIDVRAVEAQLSPEEASYLRELIVDESLLPTEVSAADVVDQILNRYRLKDLEGKAKELKRRMLDQSENQDKLFEELQSVLDRRREVAHHRMSNHTGT